MHFIRSSLVQFMLSEKKKSGKDLKEKLLEHNFTQRVLIEMSITWPCCCKKTKRSTLKITDKCIFTGIVTL